MPQLSVVTISTNGSPLIEECLAAFEEQSGGINAEILVVSSSKSCAPEHLRKRFPRVRFLPVSERVGIPELRFIGVSQAAADIVAITEDQCVVSKNWFEEIMKAHGSEYEAIGGPIEIGSSNRLVNWAVYLCEYSRSMMPVPEGEVDSIAGNNASYKKQALEGLDESVRKGCWEFFIHEEMKKRGARFLSVPTIVVQKKKEFCLLHSLFQRFHYSRSFAGMRSRNLSPPRRALHILFTPFLPLLMTCRIAGQVIRKKRFYKEFALSFPVLATLLIGYATGEFAGYLFGPGKSLAKVE